MIWDSCDGVNHIGSVSGTLFRLVESQEQVATMGYVETLDEQALLEEMLEHVKPTYPDGIEPLHYLLTTPFRYPPLPWGSRFGRTNEPSLFYGGSNPSVTLAESAFYRFIFLNSMEGVTAEDKIRSEHTMFNVDYQSDRGVQLQSPPFNQHTVALTHPQDYSHTQQLGSDMRASGVDVVEYESARDSDNGVCIALFNTSAFCQRAPKDLTQWLCETRLNDISFKQVDQQSIMHFPLELFLSEGTLPLPA